jgi:hypothetical protein
VDNMPPPTQTSPSAALSVRQPPVGYPGWDRLEERMANLDAESEINKRLYQYLKLLQLIAAASTTVLAAASAPPLWTATIAALIVVLEGVQQLFHYHDRWLSFRTTCETLRRERTLFLVRADPYRSDQESLPMLAMRVEMVLADEVSRFHSWEARREATS